MVPVKLLAFVIFSSICYAYRSRNSRTHQPTTSFSFISPLRVSLNPTEALSDTLGETFIRAWREALQGKKGLLEDIMFSESKWDNAYVSTTTEYFDAVEKFSNFFGEPSLQVFNIDDQGSNRILLDYQISFWYPLPWRPRIILPGKAAVTFTKDRQKIVSVVERWEKPFQTILNQMLPRLWDIWHVFCSPSPEYPPRSVLETVGKVAFVELPETVNIEVRWSCDAKFPGPPLSVLPGFSLFGELRTSKPNRDPFYTVLPVEVNAGRSTCPDTGLTRKVSTWLFHVPTSMHQHVWDKALAQTVFPIAKEKRGASEGFDDKVEAADYQVGATIFKENISIMKSVTNGALRGNVDIDYNILREFEESEKKEYYYKISPKRYVAEVSISGEVTQEKISDALKTIKSVVLEHGSRVLGRTVNMRSRDLLTQPPSVDNESPMVGLQLWNCKGCFNGKGEPAMAIYEIQYGIGSTKVYVELL